MEVPSSDYHTQDGFAALMMGAVQNHRAQLEDKRWGCGEKGRAPGGGCLWLGKEDIVALARSVAGQIGLILYCAVCARDREKDGRQI